MNIFKKLYCRTYQTVFKLAIPFLPYRSPLLIHSLTELPALLIEKRIDRVLIVTDKSVGSLQVFESLITGLKNANVSYAIFDETVPNPTVYNVEKATMLYKETDCEAIIAFGGGSAIDCAKVVGARIVKPKQSVEKMKGLLRILKKTPLFVAIPTTAGTGSEVTVTAVITDSDTNHKFTINDLVLIPDIAVLDPETTRTLPKKFIATTGMDALTHAVEAYIGRSTVKSTRADALEAVTLISENLEKSFGNPADSDARSNMLYASFLAGRAFSKSYVGYCHAVAHTLGGKYNIPHGLANAVLLPYVLEAYGKSAHKKLKDLAIAAGIADESTPKMLAAAQFIEMLRTMNKHMEIPEKLEGIRASDIPELSAYADKEANPLYPVPKLFSRKELEQFFTKVMR